VTKAYHARIVDAAKAGQPVREIAAALGAEVYEKRADAAGFLSEELRAAGETIAQALKASSRVNLFSTKVTPMTRSRILGTGHSCLNGL